MSSLYHTMLEGLGEIYLALNMASPFKTHLLNPNILRTCYMPSIALDSRQNNKWRK